MTEETGGSYDFLQQEEKDEDYVQVKAQEEEEEEEKELDTTTKETTADEEKVGVAEKVVEEIEFLPETTTTTSSSGSKSSSLKDQIRVVHESEGDEAAHPLKETVTYESNPVQMALDNTKQSIDQIAKNVQGWSDEHVAPKLKQVHSNTSKTLDNIGKGTKSLVDTHVAPHLETATTHTRRSLEQLSHGTRTLSGNIATSTRNLSTNIATSTKAVVDTHVVPNYNSIKIKTTESAQQLSSSTREMYQSQVQPHVYTVVQHSHMGWTTLLMYAPYYMGTAPSMSCLEGMPSQYNILEGTLRSFGQVAFCNNPITGFLVWIGIFIASPLSGACALVSVLCANTFAWYMELDADLLRHGYLGYNAVLVGSGIGTFLQFDWGLFTAALLCLVAGPMSVVVSLYLAPKLFRVLHIPANIILFLLLLSAIVWDDSTVVDASYQSGRFFPNVMNGVSGMYLVPISTTAWAGVLVVLGMALCSRILMASAMIGSLLGLIPLFGVGAGFNVALTITALSFYMVPTQKSCVLMVFAGFLTLLVHSLVEAMFKVITVPISTMTIPFCLTTLPILWALENSESSALQLVPEMELSTPEEFLAKRAEEAEKEQGIAEVALKKDEEPMAPPPPTEETPLIVTETV